MQMEIQVLKWDEIKNKVELNWLINVMKCSFSNIKIYVKFDIRN